MSEKIKIERGIDAAELLEMAEVTVGDICIAEHKPNYRKLIVSIEDGYITDAAWIETADDYYRNPGWYQVLSVGTGSAGCNCDACVAGDNPEDWASDTTDEMGDYLDLAIDQFIDWYA